MTYYPEAERKSAFGHIVQGGGATITASPISVSINITLNVDSTTRLADDEGKPTQLARTLASIAKIVRGGYDTKNPCSERDVQILEECSSRISIKHTS